MDKLSLYIFTVCFCCASALLKIKKLDMPQSIELGTAQDVVLDCNFEAEGEESLELKWFYNGEVEQIYQWIPESKKHGFAIGRLTGRLDLEYHVSNDTDTMYRAMRIKNVTQDLSGNYTCKVSSLENEDSATKQLIIYNPAQSGLDMALSDQDVNCTVAGIFPMPKINLYISGENQTKIEINEDVESDLDEEGLYNVTVTHRFDVENLTSSPVKFVCDLTIPGTTYYLTKSLDYYYESSAVVYPFTYLSTILPIVFFLLSK